MAEHRERRESRAGDELEEIVVKVKRCAKVVKGGKRFSFNALVVVGDRKGRVGWGYGKANEVPFAVNKGIQEGKKKLIGVPIVRTTIPHQVREKHGATSVILLPACEGTGIKAGAAARAVLELAGIHNVLTKVFGSTNPINVVKATFGALERLRTIGQIEATRGVQLREAKTEAAPAGVAPAAGDVKA
ncbi:MAG TPA: 30S ribosomal protein S5 [Planctomycetota bacterium]|nr:30S ribosomal protein S5 [Planctomycetota bacterium]